MSNLPSKTDLTGAGQVATAASAIVCKLIDTVSAAIGTVYEPCHFRRMADAKAYEIKALAKAQSEIDAQGNLELSESFKRMAERIVTTEFKRQENIDCIVEKAIEIIQCNKDVSDKAVDPDWTTRFINNAQDVTDEEMKNLWAQILAGEVAKPGSYSLRTLECLKNMSREEAELFKKAVSFVMLGNGAMMIYNRKDFISKKRYLNFVYYQRLVEVGVLDSIEKAGLVFNNMCYQVEIQYGNKVAICETNGRKVEIPIISLTSVGEELYNIVEKEYNEEFFVECMKDIRSGIIGISSIGITDIIVEDGVKKYDTGNINDFDTTVNRETYTKELCPLKGDIYVPVPVNIARD